MTHHFSRFRASSAWPMLAAAFALMLPPATAAAQELPRVQVTRNDTTIRAMRYNNSQVWRLMQADAGAIFEFIDVDGDAQQHRESNYYLVLLPRDAWGTQWVGWVSGRNVTPAPPREPVVAALPAPAFTTSPASSPFDTPVPDRDVVPTIAGISSSSLLASTSTRTLPEVVLHFAFDRSELSEAAKYTLGSAIGMAGVETRSLSFALDGHTDATGPDTYNQKLGLARAEAVRKYIVDELQVPADRIRVESHGETQPAAPNTTREGRAENRRVVVTVTAPVVADAR